MPDFFECHCMFGVTAEHCDQISVNKRINVTGLKCLVMAEKGIYRNGPSLGSPYGCFLIT